MLSKNASPLGKASATQYFHFPYSKHIAQSAKKAGPLAKRVSDVFSQSRASKLADVFTKTSLSRQAGRAPYFFWTPILGNFFISRKARKAGPLAKRVSDTISQSRASSLVKRFENAAPAWLAQVPPCASALSVPICAIRGFQSLCHQRFCQSAASALVV